MIKIANNLRQLVKHSKDEKGSGGPGWLGLGTLGLIGGGLAKATQVHNKHWARQADGSYIRRLSTMADRDNPRPYAYDPTGRPIPDDIADDLYVKKSPAQQRLRVDPNELGNAATPPAQPRLRIDPNELGNAAPTVRPKITWRTGLRRALMRR